MTVRMPVRPPVTMRAMILAAGRGERMRPLTDTCPKPMLPVGGQPLIAWHLHRLAAAGFREVVINHAHLGPVIEAGLGDGAAFGLRIRYSAEIQALETAGGIATAQPWRGDPHVDPPSAGQADRRAQAPFLVINGDVFSDFDLGRAPSIAAQMAWQGLDAWCVLVDNPDHNPSGDFALDRGRLRNTGPVRLTYSGIGVFTPRLFDGVAAGTPAPLAPLLRAAADAGRAGSERLLGTWIDVGTPQRLAELDARLSNGV